MVWKAGLASYFVQTHSWQLHIVGNILVEKYIAKMPRQYWGCMMILGIALKGGWSCSCGRKKSSEVKNVQKKFIRYSLLLCTFEA